MLKFFTIAFFAVAALSFSVQGAQAQGLEHCPAHKTKTELKSKRAKTIYKTSPISHINASLGRSGQDGLVLAYVGFDSQDALYVKSDYQFTTLPVGDEKFCVKLDRVITYFYARPTIMMPADFKKGSCEYNFILKHEKRHLQAVYDYHERNTQRYQVYLSETARSLPVPNPVEEQYVDLVKDEIVQYYDQKFGALVDQSLMELQEDQQKIDSPQEYGAVERRFAQCQKGRKEEGGTTPPKVFDNPFDGYDPTDLPFRKKPEVPADFKEGSQKK